jgi:hypothetical protein
MWILLATLGVPVWLTVGAMVGARVSARTHRMAPGAFPCKLRDVPATGPPGRWRLGTGYGRWVHDVLIVHTGIGLIRYQALAVRSVDPPVRPGPSIKLKGGGAVSSFRLRTDDGNVHEVATAVSSEALAMGPFGAVANV